MSYTNGHAWISSLAFSMPMIAFVTALGIGLICGATDEASGGKQPQAQASQDTATEQ